MCHICTASTYLPVFSLYETPSRPTQPAPPRLAPLPTPVERVATRFSNFQFTRSLDEYTGIEAKLTLPSYFLVGLAR